LKASSPRSRPSAGSTGEAGVLSYRGIDIHELAEHSNFEETTYLLWYGKLPTAAQLTEFRKELAACRKLELAHL